MNEIIQQLKEKKNVEEIYKFAIQKLYTDGPISITVLEILTYINVFVPDFFNNVKDDILGIMGVYFKKPQLKKLQCLGFKIYGDYIKDKYKINYTPIQVNILDNISKYTNFSFSAPTSTGKSYVFRDIISKSLKDVVIIVPSRALINEYYDKICKMVTDKTVNILTFVDIINTKHAKRNIFVLTPERAKELFKFKQKLNIELFLFDEAQLSDEDSIRGLFFDSIVRRVQKAFPSSKCIFSHPFISNPEAQLQKNHFELSESNYLRYQQQNVGQIFFAHDEKGFYHFGIDKTIMGNQKIKSSSDPLMTAIKGGGSILVYSTKASIYDKSVFKKFAKYIKVCPQITDEGALELIEQLGNYLGSFGKYYHSNMMEMIMRGIVIHHGSLPLQARLILEHFTQQGYCKMCFATSTLEQGINMPFDVVYLNTFEASRTLSMKNLIGRAGRSSGEPVFDYGIVVIKAENMSNFRKVILQTETLKNISLLDTENDEDADYKDFKEAINNGTYSDEFNLTNDEVKRLNSEDVEYIIVNILNSMFNKDGKLIPQKLVEEDIDCKLKFYQQFIYLYSYHLNGRKLTEGEESVLNTAIKILLWKIHCKTFKDICLRRYAYAARVPERRNLEERGIISDHLKANFIRGYDDLPNKVLQNYSIYKKGTKAKDVDYDRIVFDTYDYLDKLISFKLSDIYYAIFHQYYVRTLDNRALYLSNYFKYGTKNEKEIMMLRYGLSFEEIEWAKDYIQDISTAEITFTPNVKVLSPDKLKVLDRFIF